MRQTSNVRKTFGLTLALAALLAACGTGNPGNPGTPGTPGGPSNPGGGGGDPAVGPGVIAGRALDARGKPIANALIWVKPALTTGLVTSRTDEDGRYRVSGLPTNLPFEVYAWARPEYNGKRYCLRLGHDKATDYDAVVPTSGIVRDFRWKLEGVIEDRGEDTFFGGQVRRFLEWKGDDDFTSYRAIELRFEPTGPLVDGSTGRVVTRAFGPDDVIADDIPVGAYTVTATLVGTDGTSSPLKIGPDRDAMADETEFEFSAPEGGCGGSFGNGTSREFLYISRP